MDWLVVLLVVCYAVITLAGDLRLIYYFEHQDDSGLSAQEAVAKIAAVLGLQLVWLMILGLPLDVYNLHSPLADTGHTAGLEMRVYWRCIWWFMFLHLLLVVPLAAFYYEADTDPRLSKTLNPKPFKRALAATLCSVMAVALLVGLCYLFLKTLHLTLNEDVCNQVNAANQPQWLLSFCEALKEESTPSSSSSSSSSSGSSSSSSKVSVSADFSLYLMAVMAFVGLFPFVVFGGVGAAALPRDLVLSFFKRGRAMDPAEARERRRELGEKAQKLHAAGLLLQQQQQQQQEAAAAGAGGSSSSKSSRRLLPSVGGFRREQQQVQQERRFKLAVYLLEQEYRQLVVAIKERGENPFFSALRLLLGLFFGLLSLCWLLHLLLYFVASQLAGQSTPQGFFRFMDWFFELLTQHQAALLALVLYFVIVVYLLLCVIKGCLTVGKRWFCCFGIHPMRKDGTRLNSLLFNVGLLGISSCGAVLFSYNSFKEYSRGTEAALAFGLEFVHLPFFGVIYRYHLFEYLFILCFILTVLESFIRCCCCSPKQQGQTRNLQIEPVPAPLLRMIEKAAADPAAAAAAAAAAGDTEALSAAAGQAATPLAATADSPVDHSACSGSPLRLGGPLARLFKASPKQQQQQQQQQQDLFSRRKIQFSQGPGASRAFEEAPAVAPQASQPERKKKWGRGAGE